LNGVVFGAGEMRMLGGTEIGEATGTTSSLISLTDSRNWCLRRSSDSFGFQIPLADHAVFFAPAEADGAIRHDQMAAVLVERQRFPIGVVGLTGAVGQIGRPQEATIDIVPVGRVDPAAPASGNRSWCGRTR
jgi:hypothetical protein